MLLSRPQCAFRCFKETRTTKLASKIISTCAAALLAFAGWLVPAARGQAFGPGSALDLDGTNGYVQVPNGVWFNGNFTIEGWVFVRSYNNWSRLVDFADGPNTNNVYLALSQGTLGYPTMGVFTNNNGNPVVKATSQLPTNQWVHLAATLSGTTGTIYINGIPAGSGTLNVAPNVVRTNNYIGRSNYGGDSYANAIFDEIRIWNVARTQAQIQSAMHVSIPTNTPGLVGLWRFDEGGGTNTQEEISGVPSYLIGGVTWINSGVPFIPYASALAPTSVAGSAATFNGVVNPGNLASEAWFEWGTTTNYGNATALINLPATNAALPVGLLVTNFNPAMVCHYAVVATNSAGTNVSADIQFLSEPIVTTLADDGSPGSIRYVIANMAGGDTVTFATNGTITLTNGEITVTNDATIAGPGAASLTINGNHSSRVFNIASNTQVNISGLTIASATATSTFGGAGGGIYNSGTLTLSNCAISGCLGMAGPALSGPIGGSGGNGGGIYNAGTLTIAACVLSGNVAGAGGVGQQETFGTPAGQGGIGGAGGALYNAGTVFLSECALSNNSGGIGGAGGSLSGSPFNYPIGPPGDGGPAGAIYNTGTATLTGCTLNGNIGGPGETPVEDFGGGILITNGPPGNGGFAGAIYNTGAASFTLCTLDGNAGGAGTIPGTAGGIYNSGLAILTASTITRNSGLVGGGIYNIFECAALNSLIADNTAVSNAPDYYGPFSSEGYNLIGNDSGSFGFFVGNDNDLVGTSNAPIIPQIGPLANNGGPTLTVALLSGSPAINAGDDALPSDGVTTDQRGFPRNSGAHVDIGAYEAIVATPPLLAGSLNINQTFGITFTNTPYAVFTVFTSTNLVDWTEIGAPTEISPGQFQFMDTSATNPAQYYRIVSP